MVNHLYTLLVNLPASESLELVDPEFSPNVLSEKQLSLRNQVFPFGCPNEYISFIARGVVRLCESSSLWDLFLQQDKRQPIFTGDILVSDLIKSISISIDPRFTQSVNQYSAKPDITTSPSPQNDFIVTQEYISSPGGTTTIGAYGVYGGYPEGGVFSSSWIVRKQGGFIVITNFQDPSLETRVAIQYTDNNNTVSVSSKLPGEDQMSIRIFGSSIPEGFNCTITAKNPMRYSYEDLYSRISTSQFINELLAVDDQELSTRLFSLFWSKDSLHDAIAAAMIAYTHSFK
jgi:hypothetical protein